MDSRRGEARAHLKGNARKDGWTRPAGGPWAAACAVVTVVLGPAAVTASALDRADAAPLHHGVAGRSGLTP
ncbi:hypothetical protein ABT278_32450 [Streptomyces sp. NPDC001228]|uniref:hypothetical protein n=1 Tax=Streptomyces sp. NPDC001228 TaxID=3154381 RepID=UPI00332C3743